MSGDRKVGRRCRWLRLAGGSKVRNNRKRSGLICKSLPLLLLLRLLFHCCGKVASGDLSELLANQLESFLPCDLLPE